MTTPTQPSYRSIFEKTQTFQQLQAKKQFDFAAAILEDFDLEEAFKNQEVD